MCQTDFCISLVAVSSAFTLRRYPPIATSFSPERRPPSFLPAGLPAGDTFFNIIFFAPICSDFFKDIVALILLHFTDAVQLTARGPPPLLGGVVDILTFLVLQT